MLVVSVVLVSVGDGWVVWHRSFGPQVVVVGAVVVVGLIVALYGKCVVVIGTVVVVPVGELEAVPYCTLLSAVFFKRQTNRRTIIHHNRL